ncbi:PEP-CTERM sorting domain-containing protein [Caldimonas sp. KR1-144]|uniref:PEP-CTERM sorting domain-containing protein n=1 Tax=Caldimonas sp. KR1-144 TaxID=3400911 RepID=UPI003C0289CA
MSLPLFRRLVLCSLLSCASLAQAQDNTVDASAWMTPSFERLSAGDGAGSAAGQVGLIALRSDAATRPQPVRGAVLLAADEAQQPHAADSKHERDAVAFALVPEPSTYLLLLAGLLAVGFVAHRRGHE